MDIRDKHAVHQFFTAGQLAGLDALAHGGRLSGDKHNVFARANRLRGDKLHSGRLEHGVPRLHAGRDAGQLNHT